MARSLLSCLVMGLMPCGALAQLSVADFVQPPQSARPSTYWEWMNGNISLGGITADLEYMKEAGYGGAMIFDVGVGIPRGSVDYNSALWHQAVVHAMREAQRLGLRLMMHQSPGYSGTGGPWIAPEHSMKQLVWSQVSFRSDGKTVRKLMPQPITKMGFYRDACAFAFPTSGLSCRIVNQRQLSDHDLTTQLRLQANDAVEILHQGRPPAGFWAPGSCASEYK